MSHLLPGDFPAFFEAIHGYAPFSWQRRLAELAAEGDWPEVLDLPTASGKTASIDIAVFALACQADRPVPERSAPRRIAFVVDRRVIVAAAYQRALILQERLRTGRDFLGRTSGVLVRVAEALRRVGGLGPDEDPLVAHELRGGVYRDPSWARSIARPMVIATTVDQIGSRLLFRGYGVSDSARPIHAALSGNDILILLDEAHCALPFLQTARAVADYRRLAAPGMPGPPPFRVAVLSATPPRELLRPGVGSKAGPFGLDEEDRSPGQLGLRLGASKPATLAEPIAASKFAEALARQARTLAGTDAPRAVAIFVNRVETARKVFEDLSSGRNPGGVDVVLMIGRMRPIDRDLLVERWREVLRSGADRSRMGRTVFVVATQCLEVGADFDFDALVSECASLDALRQRFGRLNRMGRPIEAKAVILIRADQAKEGARPDPIYGEALVRTWRWLSSKAKEQGGGPTIDFGIDPLDRLLGDDPGAIEELRGPAEDAPVMFPSHIDCWAQTAPSPDPDPDPALFLRGTGRGRPEVKVCWRADLELLGESDQVDRDLGERDWIDAVSLCPPVASECMSVPIRLARNWLDGEVCSDDGGDLEEAAPEADPGPSQGVARLALRWVGPDDERTKVLVGGSGLRPGDTLVIPARAGGWEKLGHVPDLEGRGASIDVAEYAYLKAGRRAVLRLHRELVAAWPPGDAWDELRRIACESDDPSEEEAELRAALREFANTLTGTDWGWLARIALALADEPSRRLRIETYDDQDRASNDDPPAVRVGLVLLGSTRIGPATEPDEGTTEDDTASASADPVPLDVHCRAVEAEVGRLADLFELPASIGLTLATAARWHDLGKADRRFQALLHGGDLRKADRATQLLAKSGTLSRSRARRESDRARSRFPKGGRHELLSVRLAEANRRLLDPSVDLDLVLHLIAAHHGHARPFLPFAEGLEPGDLSNDPGHLRQLSGLIITTGDAPGSFDATPPDAGSPPLHRVDGGPAQRFWTLVRRHGWWGLAWLEALVRLADQTVSEREQDTSEVTP